uniref:Protein YIPF n=1 Tax=Romanomermis culicivorax TaxID=13658 RepID=A0A915JN37_ROMCU
MEPPISNDPLDHVPLMSPEVSIEPMDLMGKIDSSTNFQSTSSSSRNSTSDNFDTLDEPVWHTIKRDLGAIIDKFRHVLRPKTSQSLLREWDLWGPLFLCVLTALLLNDSSDDRGPKFTEIFIITWFGSCIVTLNTQLLGGSITFFQSLCVLGYCQLPSVLSLIACKVLLIFLPHNNIFTNCLRVLFTMIGFYWSSYASLTFLSGCHPQKRKALVVYPICLFYFIINYLIFMQTWRF